MRLNKELRQKAQEELVQMLRAAPRGLPTRELLDIPGFHGVRTLTPRQIRGILKATKGVKQSWEGTGYLASAWWQLGR